MKTLSNVDTVDAKQNISDLRIIGDGDLFKVLCKASSESEGWMKSTKAMQLHNGCLVQVTTQQRNYDGSYALSEALTFVPDVKIEDDINGGRGLIFS